MPDVIGQDDREERAPRRLAHMVAPLSPSGRWTGGLALLVAASGVLLVAGGTVAGRSEGPLPQDRARAQVAREPASVEARPRPLRRPDLAVRPVGGLTERTDAGARGEVRLEVRNGGGALQLESLTAEVPGVVFEPVARPHGVQLASEERVELVLGWTIEDCARLWRTGRLVLVVDHAGVRQEIGLTVTHDYEAGTVRQVALDQVLGACP